MKKPFIVRKLSSAKTVFNPTTLKYVIGEQLFRISLPLIGLADGYNFWRPKTIGVEPTTRCNLNCIMCARRYWDEEKNPIRDMPIDLFKERVLPYLHYGQNVILQCQGEPLLGKDFFEMISECKHKGCKVQFNTNGILLKGYAGELVGENVDSITVSVDGIRSFKDIRGIDISSVIDGIHEINSVKRRAHKGSPVLGIEFVAMERNIRELPDLVTLAYSLEIKSVNVVHAIIHSRALLDQSLFKHPDLAQEYFDEAAYRAGRLRMKINLPPVRKTVKFCRQPFEMMFINWDGTVRPCCISTLNEKGAIAIGNVKRSSLDEIWNSPEMRKLRVSLLKGKDFAEFCENCAMREFCLDSHTRILEKG
ncbi:MAG: SPASM domain-containing protein [Candidatus Omnitrophica bacterium]|nr:SPASM domain-containing protein [Candidatus Omnitrophota bacterium]